MAKSRSGFTLVELSIVLVIIGLVVGGVLVGRDMIKAAEMRSIQSDAEKIGAAVRTFQTKYNEVPGDMDDATTIWGTDPNGCPDLDACNIWGGPAPVPASDNVLRRETCNGSGDGMVNHCQETTRFWQQLADAELIGGSFNGNYDMNLIVDIHVPKSRMRNIGYNVWWYGTMPTTGYLFAGDYGHVMWVGEWYGNATLQDPIRGMTPAEALQFDSKFDDGKPGTGMIRQRPDFVWYTNCLSNPNDQELAAYDLSITTNTCPLLYRRAF